MAVFLKGLQSVRPSSLLNTVVLRPQPNIICITILQLVLFRMHNNCIFYLLLFFIYKYYYFFKFKYCTLSLYVISLGKNKIKNEGVVVYLLEKCYCFEMLRPEMTLIKSFVSLASIFFALTKNEELSHLSKKWFQI